MGKFASITLNFAKHLNNNNNKIFYWIKIPSQDLCDGNRVVKEIQGQITRIGILQSE